VTYEIIPKEEAIKHAIKFCRGRKLYHLLKRWVINAIEIVQEYLDREENGTWYHLILHHKTLDEAAL
jgi:cyanophycin synthetase